MRKGKRQLGAYLFLVLTITSCANVTSTQDRCFDNGQAFAAQVDCIKAGVAENRGMRKSDAMRDYVATADHLKAQVQEGRIGKDDARARLRAKLEAIKEEDVRQRAADLDYRNRFDRNYPTFTDCSRDAGSMACVTY